MELLLEKGRQSIDRSLPSRANCIFALDSLEKFEELARLMRINIDEYDIYEVEAKRIFKADMYLVDTIYYLMSQSITITSMLIDYYWKGYPLNKFKEDEGCFWEYLLEPPVKVIKKVSM